MTDEGQLGLADLVRNGTMSAEIAATLATAAAERRSLLVIAVPRNAGKTTTLRATLEHAPKGTAVHHLSRDLDDLGIPPQDDAGYLFMSEIAQTGFPDYLWGEEVRRVFASLERGFSLATALHAASVDEAFEVICGANEVLDRDAGGLDLALYIHTEGPWDATERRRIAELREVEAVKDGRPQGGTLFRWHEDGDRFERVDEPAVIGSETPGGVNARVDEFTGERD